jgi:septal ring-binding cell division protein DamX
MVSVPRKQVLFIYDRKEMIILIFLGMMVAVFAFTLGIHLGKKVGPKGLAPDLPDTHTVATLSDKTPNRQELQEQSKGAAQVDETVSQELHDEVMKTRLKISSARQVDLPKGTRSSGGGATTLKSEGVPAGAYTLQVGSHPGESEAQAQLKNLEKQGLPAFMKEVELKGKGKWYRVYVGGYETRDEADQAGRKFHSRKLIRSFIVAKNP